MKDLQKVIRVQFSDSFFSFGFKFILSALNLSGWAKLNPPVRATFDFHNHTVSIYVCHFTFSCDTFLKNWTPTVKSNTIFSGQFYSQILFKHIFHPVGHIKHNNSCKEKSVQCIAISALGIPKYFSSLTSFVSVQHTQGFWKFLDYTELHYSQNNRGLFSSTPNPCVFRCFRLFYQYPNLTLIQGKMVTFLAYTKYPLQNYFSLQLSVNIFVVSTFECLRKTRLGRKQFLSDLINWESHCRKVRKRPSRSHSWSNVTFLSENRKTALGQDYDPFNPKFRPLYWQ